MRTVIVLILAISFVFAISASAFAMSDNMKNGLENSDAFTPIFNGGVYNHKDLNVRFSFFANGIGITGQPGTVASDEAGFWYTPTAGGITWIYPGN